KACEDPPWFLTATGRSPAGEHDVIDNPNGFVQVAYGTTGNQPPPTGSGTIALIQITALSRLSGNLRCWLLALCS
ncbi:MAG: hypothetical protein HGB14_10220, partial [Anaerolineaceae bacterium]|nr:hypothetical protein [Anaerolineaceae bacterium]